MLLEFDNTLKRTSRKHIFEFLDKRQIRYTQFSFQGRDLLNLPGMLTNKLKDELQAFSSIERIIRNESDYKLVSKSFFPKTIVKVDNVEFGGKRPVIIAGPCAVESENQIITAAREVKMAGAQVLRGGAFKPRTSPYEFQGLGEKGLKLLRKAKEMTGLPVVSEVLSSEDISLVAEYVDILQIGSRNMHSSKLLKAAGKIDKPVLLKRGMSSTLNEFLMAAEYIMAGGNANVILCERGIRTHVGYSRNTLDITIVPALKKETHLPVIVDPSHASGRSDLVESLSLASLAAGAHGLMIEVHPDPERSLSDAGQALSPEEFRILTEKAERLIKILPEISS